MLKKVLYVGKALYIVKNTRYWKKNYMLKKSYDKKHYILKKSIIS